MLAGAVRDYLGLWGVSPGDRTVLVTNNDDAYRTALALHAPASLSPPSSTPAPRVTGRCPTRPAPPASASPKAAASPASGRPPRQAVAVCVQAGEGATLETIACDAVAMSGGWSPAVHLWSHCGGKLTWDEAPAHFAPDPARPPRDRDGAGFVLPAGAASGVLGTAACLASAHGADARRPRSWARPGDAAAPRTAEAPDEAPPDAVWSCLRAPRRRCARRPSSTSRTT